MDDAENPHPTVAIGAAQDVDGEGVVAGTRERATSFGSAASNSPAAPVISPHQVGLFLLRLALR
jgi:hypothetical protein